jgi:type II secretory pathway component PulC
MAVQHALTALQLVLGVGCGYGLYSIAATLVADAPAPETRLPETPVAVAAAPPALDHYRVIVERDLFHSAKLPDAPPVPSDAEALAESRRPLRLRGTIVAGAAEHSLAVIEDLSRQETQQLHEGESIGELRIERIRRGSVVVSHRGGLERLTFQPEDEAEGSRKAGTRGRASSARRASAAKRASAAQRASASMRASAARTAVASAKGAVPRPPPVRAKRRAAPGGDAASADGADGTDAAESAATSADELDPDVEERLRELSTQARFLPDFAEEGGLRGIVVRDLQAGTTLERLGLQNGDVILAVEGRRIEQTDNVFEVLRGLELSEGATVELERSGALRTLEVPAGVL